MPDQMSLETSNSRKLAVYLSIMAATFSPLTAADTALLLTGYTVDSAASPADGASVDLSAALLQLGIGSDTEDFSPPLDEQILEAQRSYTAAVSSLDEAQTVQPFAQLYSPCMMILATHAGGEGIRLPDNGQSVALERWNQATGEAFSAVLAAPTTGPDRSEAPTQQAPAWLQTNGQTATLLGYQAVGYSGIPDDQGMVSHAPTADSANNPFGAGQDGYNIAVAVDFQQSYTAMIATKVNGSEIARQFLENLHELMLAEQKMHPLYQGKLQRQVELLELGIALKTIATQDSRIGGSTVGTTTRESWVSGIQLVEAAPELCLRSFIPADFQ